MISKHKKKRSLWHLRQLVMPDLVITDSPTNQSLLVQHRVSGKLLALLDLDALRILTPITVHPAHEILDGLDQDGVFEVLHDAFDSLAAAFWTKHGFEIPRSGFLPTDCLELEDFVMILYVRKDLTTLGTLARELLWLDLQERCVFAEDYEEMD
jgi:hypothetical protein